MRDWRTHPEPFESWRPFAALLDHELKMVELFAGNCYRSVDCVVPPELYQKGAVVTWNQPSSASTSPKVAKLFLRGGTGRGIPSGTLFIIHAVTARPVSKYSVHPEEAEVLFRAGTQFQVRNKADKGLKELLEAAMRCNLGQVEVYELREAALDSWHDVPDFLDPVDKLRNAELLDLIASLPKRLVVRRTAVKEISVPMTTLIRRPSDKATALHLAVSIPENLSCVQLISAQLSPDDFSATGGAALTPLQLAAKLEHADVAVHLLHRGASMAELSDEDLCAAAPWIGELGNDDLVQAMCKRLVDHDTPGSRNALHEALLAACPKRSRRTVTILLSAGSPPVAAPRAPAQPLTLAAGAGNMDVLGALLELRVDVHMEDREGQTALMAAAHAGHTAAVRALVGAKADVQGAKDNGWTPLMLAAQEGHRETVALLLRARADVHAATPQRWTALMAAAQHGSAPVVDALLAAGARVHFADESGATALTSAAENGHVEALRALMAAHANLRAVNAKGWDATMLAAQNGHVFVVQELLGAGADANSHNSSGFTALMTGAQNGHVAVVQLLLRRKATPNARDEEGCTALSYAAQNGHQAVIHELLQARADPDREANTRSTPLMLAAENGQLAAIRTLLQAKAAVNAADADAWTALTFAAQEGHTAALQLLLRAKADVDHPNDDGCTALHLAAQHGHEGATAALAAAGADLCVADAAGHTPLMLATAHDHQRVARVLRQAGARR
eukprot:TRINITY_DN3446_c0_g1_i1.p1 TRINITY_DN3446_c0_g1~~TRINITY_DN3446_c0_g1_i1.p1  ORF type:complete len:807 (+),score=209.40 TRINITY_DN3446_c0_g1_i1:215-2422(+)